MKYREKFINKYFCYEKNTYRWVHLEESHAIELEENNKVRLLSNTYIEFEKNNKKIREYHVDTHSIFMSDRYKKNLSVRKDPSHTRPLMIIGQDETVFKQYSFSQKCWLGPGGETQLLPKSDGYSRMISGFVSRSFGVRFHLTQDELNKINERRMGSEWGKYLSRESSLAIYGTTKKKNQRIGSP